MAVSTPTPAEAAKQSHRFGDDHLRPDRLRTFTLFRRVNLASIRWSRAVFVVISLGLAGASLLATVSLTDAVSRPFRLLVDRLHTAAPEAVFVRPAVGSWMPETVLRDVDPELRPAPVAAGFSTLRSGAAQVGVLVIGGDCRLESVIGAFDCGSHMQQLSAVVGEGPSVALSSGAASALGVSAGDPLDLPGDRRAHVGTLVDGGVLDDLNESMVVFGSVTDVADLLGHGGQLSFVVMPTAGDSDQTALRRSLGTGLVVGPGGAQPRPPILQRAELLFGLIGCAAAATGLFLGMSTFLVSALERRRGLATVQILGQGRAALVTSYLIEGALLGSMAVPFALVLGRVLGAFLVERFAGSLLSGMGVQSGSHLGPGWYLAVAVATVGLGAVAAAATAGDVVVRAPLDVIDDRDTAAPLRNLGWRHLVLSSAVVAVGIAVARATGQGVLPPKAAYIGIGMVCVGAIASTVVLGPRLARFVPPLPGGWFVPLLVRADLSGSPMRTGVTVAMVMLGLMVFVGTQGTRSSVEASMRDAIPGVVGTEVVVLPQAVGEQQNVPLSDELIEAVDRTPGVEVAIRGASTTISDRLGVTAVEPVNQIPFRGLDVPGMTTEEMQLAVAAGDVLLTRLGAAEYGTRAGSDIELPTSAGVRRFHVAGVGDLRGGEVSGLGATMLVRLDIAQDAWGVGISGLFVHPEDGVPPDELKARLPQAVGVHYYTGPELADATLAVLGRFLGPFNAVGWMALAVAALGVMNMLVLVVVTQGRQRAGLRALGMTADQEALVLVGDALVLGGVGALLGVVTGLLLEAAFVGAAPYLFTMHAAFRVDWTTITWSVLGAFAAVSLGAVSALWAVRDLDVISAITAE